MPRLLPLLVAFAAGSLALARQGASDKVVYIDRKSGKQRSEEGEAKESAAGVKVLVNGKEKLSLSPADVVRVEYGDLPGITGEDRGTLLGLETEKDAVKARAGFSLLRKKATADRSRKYLEFRELQSATRVVDAKAWGDEFRREAVQVADAWAGFAKAYPVGWEVWPAQWTRARLLADAGEYAKAADALDTLAATPNLPPEQKLDAALARCDALLRSGSTAARPAVDAVLTHADLPKTGPQRERAMIYRAWASAPRPGDPQAKPDPAAAEIQAALDAAKDPTARAAGFRARGELLLAFARPKDARWEFLWVETVYNHDKDELAKALRRLAEIFDTLRDPDRADQYRDKLKKLRGGT